MILWQMYWIFMEWGIGKIFLIDHLNVTASKIGTYER